MRSGVRRGCFGTIPSSRLVVCARRTRARVRTGSYTSALRETSAGLRLVEGLDEIEAIGARATLRAMEARSSCSRAARARR